jgi:SH3 domain protein
LLPVFWQVFFISSFFGYCKILPGLLLKQKKRSGGNMRGFVFFMLVSTLLFTGVTGYAQSRTGYVTDMLILTFRQGPGPTHQILKTLESNTPLTILDEKNNYFRVQLSSGETGWVDKQFVMFAPPKTLIIENLEQEKAALEKQVNALSAANVALKDQVVSTRKQYAALPEKSRDILQIIEKSKQLEKENQQLAKQVALLENESSQLFKTGMIKWFLAGFAVIIVGWLIGRSVSSRSSRRNSLLD